MKKKRRKRIRQGAKRHWQLNRCCCDRECACDRGNRPDNLQEVKSTLKIKDTLDELERYGECT